MASPQGGVQLIVTAALVFLLLCGPTDAFITTKHRRRTSAKLKTVRIRSRRKTIRSPQWLQHQQPLSLLALYDQAPAPAVSVELYTGTRYQKEQKIWRENQWSNRFSRLLSRNFLRICLPVLLATAITTRAAFAGTVSASSLPATLGKTQLLLASLLAATSGSLALWRRGLPNLAKDFLISCVRCSMQLYILGGIVLHRLLGATRPGILVAWIVGIGLIAAQQAVSRLDYVYDDIYTHLLIAIMGSVVLVLGVSIATNMLGVISPWFAPSTIIPVAGMLFGNAISASSIAAKTLTREFVSGKAALELRLARGASVQEALRPLIRTSLSDALTPTINTLAITGIVHMPGMMTGQILAGQNPQQAAAYQTLILFLIASTASISVQLLTHFVTHKMIDFKDIRLLDRLKPKNAGIAENPSNDSGKRVSPFLLLRAKIAKKLPTTKPGTQDFRREEVSFAVPIVKKLGDTLDEDNLDALPVLTVEKLRVKRIGQQVSLTVQEGDRIGIVGTSGSGKTQILRSLVGLEMVDRSESSLRLGTRYPKEMTWPDWRRQVSWISQDRPTVEGTPNMLFAELVGYKSQSRSEQLVNEIGNPLEIAKDWNLEPEAFDRPWVTLSGGEAQRASLAIALALKPRMLLLDEATSGLDAVTQTLFEESLLKMKIPIIMVTHSKDQLLRFCTHVMELEPAIEAPLTSERPTSTAI